MDAGTLHQAIVDAGCPTLSTTVVDGNNRATWSFVPDASATQPQIDAANNVIATIPITPLTTIQPSELISRFTNAEYIALKNQQQTDFAGGVIGNIKNWDTMMGGSTVNMNSRSIKAIKNNLVATGVLTQARADVIFS